MGCPDLVVLLLSFALVLAWGARDVIWHRLWYPRTEHSPCWLLRRRSDGRVVARLSDPRLADTFWVSWAIEPLVDDERERQAMLTTREWWDRFQDVAFEAEANGRLARHAFPAGRGPADGRIEMRALYLTHDTLLYRLASRLRPGREQSAPADRTSTDG